MRVCTFDPTECESGGGPPCSALLVTPAAAPLRALAARLIGRAGEVAGRLAPGAPLAEEGETRALLAALAAGATHELALLLLAEGRRLAGSGRALAEAIRHSREFADACLETLASDGSAPAEQVRARAALALLGEVQTTIHACAFERAAAAPQPAAPAAPGDARPRRQGLAGLNGASEPMQRLYDRIELASRGRETVLVVGESGTGKELVARAIHAISGDPGQRFVAVNCAALPRELMESELFGHRRGAFSGADQAHAGLVRAASGGTLFLDEIAELAPEAQAKLLRVIQERAVRAVGETREVPVEVRIVAATNQRPEDLLATGRLRRDLYYRLARFTLPVPSLRERLADLPDLAEHLAARWARPAGATTRRLAPAVLERLAWHDWPGNVRELENVLFAALAAAGGRVVTVDDLPPLTGSPAAGPGPPQGGAPRSLRAAERETIARVLSEAGGNKTAASRVLGISRKQLYVKLREYGIAF